MMIQPSLPTLETERLILRPCTRDDEPDLHAIYWNTVPDEFASQEKARRPNRRDIREENEYFLSFVNYPFLRPFGRMLVILKVDASKIGTCSIIPHVFTPEEVALCADGGLARFGTLEVILGWSLTKAYRGHGYGTEAARALVDYGLNTLHLQRVLAEAAPDNLASIQVMKKIGMKIISPPGGRQVIGMIER